VNNSWLLRLYEDVGLTREQAQKAAEETRQRLLRRERPRKLGSTQRPLTEFLVRDPLISLNRIIGRGDEGLPFFDEESKQLSLIAFSSLLAEIGLDPVVALAFAKVVVEAWEPKDLYGPIWTALGQKGPLDLEALRRMDWTTLRADVPPPSKEARDTVVTRKQSFQDTVVSPATPTTAPPAARTETAAHRRAPPVRPSKTTKPKKT
jgi:hypothetical protein